MTIKSTGYAINPFTGRMEWIGRLRRPPYYRDSDDANLIRIDCSDTQLLHFLIGNRVYLVDQPLRCNLATEGAGGLDRGTLAANTPYYLYAIVSGNGIDLIASLIPPGDGGPQGYDLWTYIGACATDEGSADFSPFSSSNGIVRAVNDYQTEQNAGTTAPGITKVFNCLPVTATVAYGLMSVSATNTNAHVGYVRGDTSSNGIYQRTQITANRAVNITGEVSVITAQTLNLLVSNAVATMAFSLYGWTENPMEWM